MQSLAAATVFSGQDVIAPNVARFAALEIMKGQDESGTLSARAAPERFHSSETGSSFRVNVVRGRYCSGQCECRANLGNIKSSGIAVGRFS